VTEALRRILLVGFMGSGKSTVGPRVAAALGWRYRDFDQEIEARAGCTVARIFARDGEAAFRSLEADVADDLLREDHVVLGSGGGWAAVSGRLDGLPAGTLSVWLRVTPEDAVARVRAQVDSRPLLATDDPLATARALLMRRESRYARAQCEVDTTGLSPEDVTRSILSRIGSAGRNLNLDR